MRRLLLCLSLLLLAAPAWAQDVINPNAVSFTVSPDHNVVLPDGRPMVSGYAIAFFAEGASDPVSSTSFQKPTAADGASVVIDLTQAIISVPIDPTTRYTARIVTQGFAGESESEPSDPFVRAAPPGAATDVRLFRR